MEWSFTSLYNLKKIERFCIGLDICLPMANAVLLQAPLKRQEHSTGQNHSESSHSHFIFLSVMRLWQPLCNNTANPRSRRASRWLLLKQKHPRIKVCLGKIKVNIFWTCCCWQHVFNLQRKFVGSLSARGPDGPGNWELVMSHAAFQVSASILNGAQLTVNYLILLETFATWANPLDSFPCLKHELKQCLIGISKEN